MNSYKHMISHNKSAHTPSHIHAVAPHQSTFVGAARGRLTIILAALCALIAASSTHAQFFNNYYGIYDANCALGFGDITFPDNTPLTTQYMVQGVVFSNVFYNSGGAAAVGPHVDAWHIGNFQTGGLEASTFSFMFKSVVNAAAFSLVHSFPNGSATFTAFLNGVMVAVGNAAIGSTYMNYYGFEGLTFDRIDVAIHSTTGRYAVVMDNLAFREGEFVAQLPRVPESGSTLPLLVLGCAGVGLARRSKS